MLLLYVKLYSKIKWVIEMEFLQLKYFKHAAQTENFSHTANSFRVPASCVSSSVKKLEDELGAKLFDRKSNSLKLNEKGKIFLKATEKIFKELENAEVEIAKLSGETAGKINMLINNSRHILTPLISEFSTVYPKVSFTIDFDGDMNYGNYDIIVTDDVIDNSSFERVDFLKEELFLAVNKNNPLSEKKRVDICALSDEKFICLRKNHRLRIVIEELFARGCIAPDIVVECNDIQCINDYLKMGMGVSIIPGVSWKDRVDSSLKLLRLNEGIYRNTAIYINVNSSYLSRLFFDFVKENVIL